MKEIGLHLAKKVSYAKPVESLKRFLEKSVWVLGLPAANYCAAEHSEKYFINLE